MTSPPATTRRYITDLQEQEQVDQVFRAADKQLRANRQGGKYILLRLTDRSGTLTGMLWNADERIFESFERGDYIRCRGRTQVFNGGLQMIVTRVDRVDEQSVDPADFERFDRDVAGRLTERLRELLAGIENADLRRLSDAYLADEHWVARLQAAPAAVNNHHAYPGGLLQHTVDLMELVHLIAPRYPQLDRDLLLVGAFLHDLGKIEELASGDELSYTDRGQLVGHLVIGVQLLDRRVAEAEAAGGATIDPELRWQLEHMILSHHGQLEYGSPKVPMTLEALALHHLDNLDAKMAAATSVLQSDVAADSRWTNYNPGFGRKLWKPDSGIETPKL